MKTAVFCGTFDPFTLGHLDILEQAASVFDKLYVAVPLDSSAKTAASIDSRIKIARASIQGCQNAEVVSFSGLATDFCSALKIDHIVRGIRNTTDFVYENDLAKNYQSQNASIRCVYFFPSSKTAHISSSMVRELVKYGGNIHSHVSKDALKLIEQAYKLDKYCYHYKDK